MNGETYENLCDGTEIVLELIVSVDDGATDKDLRLRHDGGVWTVFPRVSVMGDVGG